MQNIKTIFIILALGTISCNHHQQERPSTALDTGRVFIDASLKGNFNDAQLLLLNDNENKQLFEAFKLYYQKMSTDKKAHYRSASYQINKYTDLNDSTTIINYANDYMNKPMEIKIVKRNKEWFIDFKYTYSGNLPIN
jgi:hypothetical protein